MYGSKQGLSLSTYPIHAVQKTTFSRVEFLRSVSQLKKKEKENRCVVFTFSMKREIKKFHVVVVPVTAKKCTKLRNARAKLLFAYKASSHVSVFVWKRIFFSPVKPTVHTH